MNISKPRYLYYYCNKEVSSLRMLIIKYSEQELPISAQEFVLKKLEGKLYFKAWLD